MTATLIIPIILTVSSYFGMAPMELQVKVKADPKEVQEVCVVVDGEEYHKDCQTTSGITTLMRFTLHAPGAYTVQASGGRYATRPIDIEVR